MYHSTIYIFFNKPKNMFTMKKEDRPQCRRPSRRKAQLTVHSEMCGEEDPFLTRMELQALFTWKTE